MRVEIYSDVACPWCYIGKRRFERALAELDVPNELEVVMRPFQLDPSTPAVARPLLPALERKFGPRFRGMSAHTAEVAKEEGLAFDWERALDVNTLTAHRLLYLALRDYGPAVQSALAERLFDAHFARGGDIGDHAQLTELAVASGMDRARTAAALASDDGLAEVRRQLEEARELGVTAVPTFVFDGRYAVQGAQPTAVFRQVLERVAAAA